MSISKTVTTNIETIEEHISETIICRIGLCNNNVPYIIPMNFGYRDNCLYLHSGNKGTKLEIIKKNNSICFEMDAKNELVKNERPCKFGMKYISIIGSGKAYIIEDIEEKIKALNIIMQHYTSGKKFDYDNKNIDSTVVFKVAIDKITCKKRGY